MSGTRLTRECPYNDNIDCERHVCDSGEKCGWHPLIKEYRKREIRKNLPKVLAKASVSQIKTLQKKQEKRDRGKYLSERILRLKAEGRCPICGGRNDRPDRFCCTACWERKREQENRKKAT